MREGQLEGGWGHKSRRQQLEWGWGHKSRRQQLVRMLVLWRQQQQEV
jgi:hypothetical protein